MRKKRFLFLLLILAAALSVSVFAHSGACGDNAEYLLENKTLTIRGTGEMYDYSISSMPWYKQQGEYLELEIDEGITYVGSNAFYNNHARFITLPGTLKSIGDSAFCSSAYVLSIEFPDGLESIGQSAFIACTKLREIYLPKSLTRIGEMAFDDCPNLTDVYFGGTEEEWQAVHVDGFNQPLLDAAFHYGSSGLNHSPDGTCGENVTWTRTNGTLIIEGTGAMEDYTDISQIPWFEAQTTFDRILIREGVTGIGKNAFSDCTSVASVRLPSTLRTLGECAFCRCSALQSVTLPEGITALEYGTFDSCTSLTSITLPDTLESIGMDAFANCTSLKELTIPGSVTVIESGAFSVSGLTSIVLPEKVRVIENNTFYHCAGLISVTFPSGLERIGESVFDSCKKLKSISLPQSVTEVGRYAFQDCTALESVEIPDAVATLGSYAFSGCTSLKVIRLPKALTEVPSFAFNRCSGLEELDLHEGITSVGSYAFSGCSGLKTVWVPGSMETISQYAFNGATGISDVYYPLSEAEWEMMVDSRGNASLKYGNVHFGATQLRDGYTDCAMLCVYLHTPEEGDAFCRIKLQNLLWGESLTVIVGRFDDQGRLLGVETAVLEDNEIHELILSAREGETLRIFMTDAAYAPLCDKTEVPLPIEE